MELYFKNESGLLEETTLASILSKRLTSSGFKLENGKFSDNSCVWIGVVQESKNKSEVIVNICFENDGNTITGAKVHESQIKIIVDRDNMKSII